MRGHNFVTPIMEIVDIRILIINSEFSFYLSRMKIIESVPLRRVEKITYAPGRLFVFPPDSILATSLATDGFSATFKTLNILAVGAIVM